MCDSTVVHSYEEPVVVVPYAGSVWGQSGNRLVYHNIFT